MLSAGQFEYGLRTRSTTPSCGDPFIMRTTTDSLSILPVSPRLYEVLARQIRLLKYTSSTTRSAAKSLPSACIRGMFGGGGERVGKAHRSLARQNSSS